MFESIKNFYNSKKYAIWWTVCYVAIVWVIMQYMFNFNIFSSHRWHQLMHAHLHGFPGLVFGILILAMVPLYVATTIVVARNNAPLFNFKLSIPQFIKDAFYQTPADEDTPTPENTPALEQTETTTEPEPTNTTEKTVNEKNESVPEQVPAELKMAYINSRNHISRVPTSAFDLGNVTNTKQPKPESTEPLEPIDLPIPNDFDINDTSSTINGVPVFTDLDMDDDIENIDLDSEPDSDIQDVKTITDTNEIVAKYLTAKSVNYTHQDDVIITDHFAIVSHTDPDFWVADTDSWFAAGKIRKSPIASVLANASQHNVEPVLYLGADNIMDISDLRAQWESNGIRIVTDLKDLI